MAYTIKYTETGNPQKPDISVADQELLQQLSCFLQLYFHDEGAFALD
jgi:hypothetical protein